VDADAHFRSSIKRLGISSLEEISEDHLVDLALKFAIWPSVATYCDTPWFAPFAIRRIRVRVEPNAPGVKRDLWGLPNESGYLTDDNSWIKGLILNRTLSPETNPYGGSRITRGVVCCHIWSGTTTSPLLFSFVPNLVWLPKSLARYSDAHSAAEPHPIHNALKQISLERYGSIVRNRRVESAWQLLEPPTPLMLNHIVQTEIADDGKISDLVKKRVKRMIDFLEATLDPNSEMPQRFSKRYHAGIGKGIDKSVWPVQSWLTEEVRLELLEEMRICLENKDDKSDLTE
jgi:hypothetical protein